MQLHDGTDPWERIDSVWVLNEECILNTRPSDGVEALPDSTTTMRAARMQNPLPLMVSHLYEVLQDAGGLRITLERYGSSALIPTEWVK